MTHFIVQTSSAKMPSSCWGTYRRVAVLKVNDGVTKASMISERSRDVLEVIWVADRLYVGTTERCAYQIALAEAEEMATRYNARAH